MEYQELHPEQYWTDGFMRGLFYGVVIGLLLGGFITLLYHALI
jgi:hypothetical protein